MYLQKILDINNQKSTALSSCLPASSENRFAYYTSCIVDPENPNKSLGNVVVFISIFGTRVTSTTLNELKALYDPDKNAFPKFYHSTMLQGVSQGSVLNSLNYITLVAVSVNAITDGSTPVTMGVRTDDVDAYKCVPFDPENDVKNGTIQVDLNTGKPLTDELANRAQSQEKPPTDTGNLLSPGKIERFLGNSLGLFLAISLGIAGFYFLVKVFRGHVTPDKLNENLLPGWIKSSPILITVAFICAFIGFLVGSTLSSGT
jgi:hypothetical protein